MTVLVATTATLGALVGLPLLLLYALRAAGRRLAGADTHTVGDYLPGALSEDEREMQAWCDALRRAPAGRRGDTAVLVCGGRDVDNRLQPVGEPCGRTYLTGRSRDLHEHARAAGWSIVDLPGGGLAVTCDRCRRPNPALAALARTIHRGPEP